MRGRRAIESATLHTPGKLKPNRWLLGTERAFYVVPGVEITSSSSLDSLAR